MTERLVVIRRPSGSALAFCDGLDAERWLVATGTDSTTVDLRDDPAIVRDHCVHCAWCGIVAAAPIRTTCVMHAGGPCPDFTALVTVKARRVVMELRKAHGGDLPPRCFDILEQAAADLNAAGQFEYRRLLALVWGQRSDWAG